MKKYYSLLLLLFVLIYTANSQTSLIPYGSPWKYLDNGTNQGTAWRAIAFNDAAWVTGYAQLGYGDGDEATIVSYGPNVNNKYITTYFRKTISVTNASSFTSFLLSIKRDDGAVVYINGIERFKTNMPNNVSYITKASADASDDGNTPQTVLLPAGILANGTNVIAVEIHQRTVASTDISFDLLLTGTDVTAPTITSFNPADNATNVAVNSNLVLTFSEAVQKGTGNILIKEGGIITQTIDVASASVSVAGNIVTINPADFGNGAAVNIEMAAGVFKDLANNNYAGIANATTWNFGVLFTDITPPTVTNYSPADDTINVAVNSNLVLTFSEAVQKGTGNILIKENGIITQTIDVASASVSVAGNIVTINPADFGNGAAVNIEMAAGVFKDLANNNYTGISNATTWNFGVLFTDITPPAVTNYSPADDAINVAAGSNLILTFSEAVQKGTGNIIVKEAGIITQIIDIASASVTVIGNIVTIDPADFGNGTTVNIEIAAGVFKDLANNNYAGITNASTWNFTIINLDLIPPSVSIYSPVDNATNVAVGSSLVLTFNEAVQKGTGNIIVKEAGIITQTIDVASASVSVAGNIVTIDPADFGNGAAVNIEIDVTAFKDLANNNYAGITIATTWNFGVLFTDITPPTVTNYSPADDTINVAAGSNLVLTFSEPVQKGTGNILIKENGIITQTIDVTAASVSVAGNIVTINPADFGNGAAVNIEMAAGVFKDLANNNYAGIANATTWNFGVLFTDVTPPTVINYSPVDDAINVTASSNLVLTFSEAVQKGTGNILIKEGGVTIQTIDVTSALVSVAGNVITINPSNFGYSSVVNIEIAAGVFKDLTNNNYAGIANASTWNFGVEAAPSGPQTLVAYGTSWKYLDSGTNQGTSWTGTSFNDASWLSGNAQLGYGDGDEATVVSYGPDINNKYITTYFRKNITIANPAIFSSIAGNVKRDDGVAIYINGTEVYRNNIAAGATYTTLATLASDDGATPQGFTISPSVFVSGTNVIAVEIHQNTVTSSDISFDLEVIGTVDATPPTVITYSPVDNGTSVAVNSNGVLTFSEAVQKGTGNIVVKEAGIITQTIDVASASVTVAGNTVTVDPANFTNNALVNIEIAAGAFKDLANNNYAGIADTTTWNFTIAGVDVTPPAVAVYSPLDNATNVAISSNLVLTFSENVQKGTGNILVKEAGVTLQTIDVTAASVTVVGNIVTINPADFGYTKAVNIEIAAGAFKDLANNNYAGITDAVTWNFNTEDLVTGPQTFIAYGASWKYYAAVAAPAGAWQNLGYADGAWPAGAGQLGYGDGDEATCVPSGGGGTLCLPTGNKWITTYFRKEITVSNPLAFSSFAGSVKRDDGIVLYVNGTEIYRNNMPTGTVAYTTLASTAASDDGNTAQNFTISSSAFASGNNVIAVEMHQNLATSSDLSFDLQLIGTVAGASVLTRGPYMNSALQNGIVIRWRSDVATNSKVNFGTTAGSLTQSLTDNTVTTEHTVTLTGLTANTLYYYSVGSSSQVLQGDVNNYFKTLPVVGSSQKIRVMAMGDMGNNSTNQVNVRNAWQAFNGSNYTDAWLLMGDNAYNGGFDTEYQTNFFNIYQGSLTKNHVIWPTPGNHDYDNSAAKQADHAVPYYDIFTLPKNGEAGGAASNTEAFYAYNIGNIHFVALDSYGWETGSTRLYDTLGPQAVWLKQDLAVNTQPWTVVYFHHPPYTKGSHNSDTETELINMRQNIVPILERYKVDLVLNGHSHSYERSYLLNGHYGLANTFSLANHALSSSSAKYDGSSNSCIYIKNATDIRNGIVYALVGSAGQIGGSSTGYPHNAMYYSNITNGGTLYFEVENNRLIAKWIGADGVIRDNFTIMKNVNKTNTVSIAPGSSATLTASWIGNYNWSTGAATQSIIVSPAVNTTYTVTDGAGCLTDVFNVEITAPLQQLNVQEQKENLFKVFPNTLQKGQILYVQSVIKGVAEIILSDINGRVLGKYKSFGSLQIKTDKLLPGIYFLRGTANNKTEVSKFIVLN